MTKNDDMTSLYNPLRLEVRDRLEVKHQEIGICEVFKIVACTTTFGEHAYRSVKYFLHQYGGRKEPESVVLECLEIDNATPDYYLFQILDSFDYDGDFMELLDDDILVIAQEDDEEELEKHYAKSYELTAPTQTLDTAGALRPGEIEAWNYEVGDAENIWYLTVELNTTDGRLTLYEGQQVTEQALSLPQQHGK